MFPTNASLSPSGDHDREDPIQIEGQLLRVAAPDIDQHESHPASPAFVAIAIRLAVRRPADARCQQMQFFEIVGLLPVDHFLELRPSTAFMTKTSKIVVPVRDEGDLVSLGGDRGTGIIEAPVLLVIRQPAGIVRRVLAFRDVGPVQHLQFLLPPLGQLFHTEPDGSRGSPLRRSVCS